MTHRPPAGRRRSVGTSTMDVLIGSMLALIAVGATYSFHRAQSKQMLAQNVYNESQGITRSVMDLMTRELRMASYDPTGLALTLSPGPSCPGVRQGIVSGGPSTVRFKQDLNGDGLLAGAGEDVTYDVLGTTIRRTDGPAAPVSLVDNVPAGGFLLRYFDNSNPPVELVPQGSPPVLTASQRDCVAKVMIVVKADIPNPTITTPLASQAASEVAIRNRSLMNF